MLEEIMNGKEFVFTARKSGFNQDTTIVVRGRHKDDVDYIRIEEHSFRPIITEIINNREPFFTKPHTIVAVKKGKFALTVVPVYKTQKNVMYCTQLSSMTPSIKIPPIPRQKIQEILDTAAEKAAEILKDVKIQYITAKNASELKKITKVHSVHDYFDQKYEKNLDTVVLIKRTKIYRTPFSKIPVIRVKIKKSSSKLITLMTRPTIYYRAALSDFLSMMTITDTSKMQLWLSINSHLSALLRLDPAGEIEVDGVVYQVYSNATITALLNSDKIEFGGS